MPTYSKTQDLSRLLRSETFTSIPNTKVNFNMSFAQSESDRELVMQKTLSNVNKKPEDTVNIPKPELKKDITQDENQTSFQKPVGISHSSDNGAPNNKQVHKTQEKKESDVPLIVNMTIGKIEKVTNES